MKSIERRYKKIKNWHKDWSSFTCCCESIKGQNFSDKTMHKWFYRLVEKNDYDKKDTRVIIRFLDSLRVNAESYEEGRYRAKHAC